MKKKLNLKTILILVLSLLACTSAVVYGAVVLFVYIVDVRYEAEPGTLIENEANVEFTASKSDASLSFDKSGASVDYSLSITNNTETILHYYYEIKLADDDTLSDAVLVYYNGEFLNTLSALTSAPYEGKIDSSEFLSSSTSGANTGSDKLTFELHEAVEDSYYDGKELSLTIYCYTENADYEDYLFVTDESDFDKAVKDINSGLLDNPTVVLFNDITLSSDYEIKYPFTLDLYGNSISSSANTITLTQTGTTLIKSSKTITSSITPSSGFIVLNSSTGIVDIETFTNGSGTKISETYGSIISVTECSSSLAESLISDHLSDSTGYGLLKDETISLFGNLSCYKSLFTVTTADGNYSYNSSTGIITALETSRTSDEYIIITDSSDNETYIEFKVIGTGDDTLHTEILSSYLYYLPTDSLTEVTSDLYLPKKIDKYNATITWTSGNKEVISDEGKLNENTATGTTVELYAEIKVNNSVYRDKFTFVVSIQTNATKFSDFVATISPVTLYNVYTGSNESTAYYYLPTVDADSDYDYRKDYKTPSAENTSSVPSQTYSWAAYEDMGLEYVEYSVVPSYSTFIKMDDNAVYLTMSTFYTYAQLNVTGKYKDDPTIYSEKVNLIIVLGDDTELQERVFSYISTELGDIDVLYNMLRSRLDSGMANEKGDFSLPNEYNTYSIRYTIPSVSSKIIKSVTLNADTDEYDVVLSPENFSTTESSVAIKVIISYQGLATSTEASRDLFFTVPAVLTTSNFGNSTNFNAVKVEVYNQLPSDEKANESGLLSGSNTDADYILLRDVVGDTDYLRNYSVQKQYVELLKDDATEAGSTYTKATGCTELYFYTPSASLVSGKTDEKAYDFIKLIAWATSSTKGTAASSVTNLDTYLGSYSSSVSDGKDYLNETEVETLKAYYTNATGASDWDTVWASVSETAAGYVIFDTATLNDMIMDISNVEGYFKYVECLQWADDEKDFPEAGGYTDKATPNLGVIGSYNWTYTTSTSTPSGYSTRVFQDAKGYYWYKSSSIGYQSGSCKYNPSTKSDSTYLEDDTEYITEGELEVLKVFWLNYKGVSSSSASTGQTIVNAFDNCIVKPTYFNTDGISNLINAFYTAADISINNSYNYAYVTPSVNSDMATSFTDYSIATYSVPVVYNLDSIGSGLNYFTKLENLYIYGNANLSAFLGTTTLSAFFNRITNNNTSINKLAMSYVANDYTEFTVTNTKKLSDLEYIDYSYNEGITNTSYLVNTKRANYKFVDISNVGVTYEFAEFAVQNIYNSSKGAVYYTDADGNRRQYLSSDNLNEALTYLQEFDEIVSPYMQLAEAIYDENGSTDIFWRIENGNKIGVVTYAQSYPEITSIKAMNDLISPYYYCLTSFTYDGFTYEAGNVYKVTYSDGLSSKKVVAAEELSSTTIPDATDAELEQKQYSNTSSSSNTEYGESSLIGDPETVYTQTEVQTVSTTYTITFKCYTFYSTYSSNFGRRYYYFLNNDGTKFSSTSRSTSSTTTTNTCYFAFLTEDEVTLYQKISSNNVTATEAPNTSITMGNNISSGTYYYMFNPSNNVFFKAYSGGTFSAVTYSTDISSLSTFTLSNASTGSTTTLRDNSNYYVTMSTGNNSATISGSNSSGTSFTLNSASSNPSKSYTVDLPSNEPYISVTSSVANIPTTYTLTFNCIQLVSAYNTNSTYYISDSGSQLQCTTDNSDDSTKFVLLSADDITTYNNWMDLATGDISLGHAYTDASSTAYYLYCPSTGNYVGTITGNGSTVYTYSDYSSSSVSMYTITSQTYSSGRGGQGGGSYSGYVLRPSKNTSYAISISTGGGQTPGQGGSTQTPTITTAAYNNSGNVIWSTPTTATYSVEGYGYTNSSTFVAYSFGYQLYEEIDTITSGEYLYSSSLTKYYYLSSDVTIENVTFSAGSVIKIVYTGNYGTIIETENTIYSFVYWYSPTVDGSEIYYIDSDGITSVDYVYYSGSSFTEVDGTFYSSTVTIPDSSSVEISNSSSWTQSHSAPENYITNVKIASETNLSDYKTMGQIVTNNSYKDYYYSGTSGSENVYKESTTYTSPYYTKGDGYRLALSGGVFTWTDRGTYTQPAASATTMQGVLDEANGHFDDQQYGNYYGNYYAYSGSNATLDDGTSLTQYSVYRLLPNDDNSGFKFVYYSSYTEETSIDTVLSVILNGNAVEGTIYYLNFASDSANNNRTYHSGFYVMTYNESSGSYYLKSFEDVRALLDETSSNSVTGTISRFENMRDIYNLYYTLIGSNYDDYYGGTGGTIETVISAVIHEDNGDGTYTDYVRKFKVDIVG